MELTNIILGAIIVILVILLFIEVAGGDVIAMTKSAAAGNTSGIFGELSKLALPGSSG